MARSVYKVEYTTSYTDLKNTLESILTAKGYHTSVHRGCENVWKKGTGALTAMMFIKLEYDVKTVTISGWICAGMGSWEMNEMAFPGFTGSLPKGMCKAVVEELVRAIH